MEKWTEIKPGFIPFGDYGIEINIDGDTLIAYLKDSEKFKFTFTKVWAFRTVQESLELRDKYWEQGLATVSYTHLLKNMACLQLMQRKKARVNSIMKIL